MQRGEESRKTRVKQQKRQTEEDLFFFLERERESNLLVDVRSGHDYGRWEPPLWTQPAVPGPDGDKVPRRDREPVPGSELHRHPGDISIYPDVLQRRRTRQTFGSGPRLLSEDISER